MKLGSYEMEKFLGEGAFGKVYLTKKEGDSKKYATKEFDRKEIDHSEAKKYLANEIIHRFAKYFRHIAFNSIF